MIHGVTDCKETYDRDLPELSKHFKVIRYDLRGHGHSTLSKKQFDLKDHVEDALALIRQLNLNDFYLYGGSLGSYIAQGVAVKIPTKIRKLILNVSAAHNPASALAETVKNDTLPTDLTARRKWWSKHLVYDQKKLALVEKSGFQKNNLSPAAEYRALKSISAFDFSQELNKITCPVLITSGRFDPVNPPQKSQVINHLLTNSQMKIFNSGHLLRLENTAQYDQIMINFFKTA